MGEKMSNNQRIRVLESEADDVFENQRNNFQERLANPFSSSFFNSNSGFETDFGSGISNQFKYSNDGKSWTCDVKLGNKKYSNIKIDIDNNNVKIIASEIEEINENGRVSKSISNISKSLLLPQNTIKESITTESIGSSIIIKGDVDTSNKIEALLDDVMDIPIEFE